MAFAILITVVLMVANAFAADVSDTTEAFADTSLTTVSGEDTLAVEESAVTRSTEEVEVPGEEGSRRVEDVEWWEVHPTTSLSIRKDKDVTNWESKISFNKRLNERVSLRLATSVRTRENSTLNRSDSDDATTADLKYRLNDDVTFGITYNAVVSARRFGLHGGSPAERRKKESFRISSDFNRSLTDAVDIRVKVAAGTTQNFSTRVRNQGVSQDLSASISYAPNDALSASVTYNGKRLLLDSEIDSSGVAIFSSSDRTLNQGLSFQSSYELAPGIVINLDASRSDYQKQHPDPKKNAQETEKGNGRSASISSKFNMVERLTWDLSVSFGESRRSYRLNTSRNSFVRNSSLKGSARILPWRGATINVGGEREVTRSEYETEDTGDDVHKSLTFKLTQSLGQKVNFSLTALSDLVSIFYDDKEANPKDRDRQSNRVSFGIDYKPVKNISTKFGGEYSVEKSVYIKAASSANNRTSRKYRVSGSYKITTFRNIKITQNYDVSAIYTYYHFAESKNALVRNSNIKTRFSIPITSRLKADFTHTYKYQDQGSFYEDQGGRYYNPSTETESHSLNLGINYRLTKKLKIVVRQRYFLQRNWRYKDGNKQLDYETTTTEIMGRLAFSYEIGTRTRVSFKMDQNFKEGERVNEAFRNYRNIEFEASHVF